jgi:hypothetical protein
MNVKYISAHNHSNGAYTSTHRNLLKQISLFSFILLCSIILQRFILYYFIMFSAIQIMFSAIQIPLPPRPIFITDAFRYFNSLAERLSLGPDKERPPFIGKLDLT